jgi:hypothetical protein
MANDKNTATGSKESGVVTHKLLVETKFGTFTVSLFSNNALHQAIAKKAGVDGFSEKFVAVIESCKVVSADVEKPAVDLDSYF